VIEGVMRNVLEPTFIHRNNIIVSYLYNLYFLVRINRKWMWWVMVFSWSDVAECDEVNELRGFSYGW